MRVKNPRACDLRGSYGSWKTLSSLSLLLALLSSPRVANNRVTYRLLLHRLFLRGFAPTSQHCSQLYNSRKHSKLNRLEQNTGISMSNRVTNLFFRPQARLGDFKEFYYCPGHSKVQLTSL